VRPSTPRKFTLVDAMVLIAATGVALVPIRLFLWENLHALERWSGSEIMRMGLEANLVLVPPALALTLALWLLRLKRPRPTCRRMFRQPGLAAGTATLLYALVVLISFLLYIYVNSDFAHFAFRSPDEMNLWTRIGMVPMFMSGGAVAAVWIVMRLSGAWRAEPSWIDRAGRGLGIYWVTISVLFGWIFYTG
jgi:hypothetical protein